MHAILETVLQLGLSDKSKDVESPKMTRITKKKKGIAELPNITQIHFLRMSKDGIW